jgi:adenylate cyclase class 2
MGSPSPFETEVKFRLRDRGAFESRLAGLGYVAGPSERETNVLLDDASRTLTARGMALRVRDTEGRGLLTLKGPKEVVRGVKTRLELETGVDSRERLLAILALLGFSPGFRYEKWRTTFSAKEPDRPVVVVDETPIGLFAEIEGDEAGVRALVAAVGVAEDELIAESYVGLYLEARRADPTLPADMVFA